MSEDTELIAAPAPPRWEWYLTPPDAWRAMLAACESAMSTIACEQYIFEPDEIGEQFAEVFIRKAAEGVRVRLLCDGIGSFSFIGSPLLKRLETAGVEVRFYNQPRWGELRKVLAYMLRDHRKVLVIDSRIGFIGGVGIASHMASWRDTHVRMESALTKDMDESFETMWRVAGRRRGAHARPQTPREGVFSLLNNAPRFRHRHIYHALLQSITAAKTRVYLSTAYFVPSIRLTRALRKAAMRGVDVRIIVPASSDVPLADVAARSYFTPLLRAGVKIYRYQNAMFHPKTVVFDDTLATMGSANLDNLSLLLNYEANIASTEPQFIDDLIEHFQNDLRSTAEVNLAEWHTRPFAQKCTEFLVKPLRGIL